MRISFLIISLLSLVCFADTTWQTSGNNLMPTNVGNKVLIGGAPANGSTPLISQGSWGVYGGGYNSTFFIGSQSQNLNYQLPTVSGAFNTVLTNDGSGNLSWSSGGGGGSGTVTSVAMTVPSFLSVAGSPVTTSGTLAVTLGNQSANTGFFGPGTGSPAPPTFRTLVSADIPDLSTIYSPLAGSTSLVTTGTISTGTWNATTIGVAKGGTGLTTLTANNVILGNGSSTPLFVAPSTSGNVLTSNGTTWTSAVPSASGVSVVGAFSASAQTNGATISGSTITFGPADASTPGMVSTGTQNIAGAKNFSGVVTAPAGTVSLPGLVVGNDADTGIYDSGTDEISLTNNGALTFKTFATGFAFFDPASATRFAAGSFTSSRLTLALTNTAGLTISSANTGSTAFDLTNSSTGAQTWSVSSLGSANGDYLGGVNVVSDRSGANPIIQGRKFDQIILGGNSGILTSTSVVIAGQAALTNIGGSSTINASTALSATGTPLFIQRIGVGDQVSVSSAAGTYSGVKAIASTSAATLETAIGNGTAQTINLHKAILRIDDNGAVPVGLVSYDGNYLFGNTANVGQPKSRLHVDAGNATASALQFTVGTTSGTLATDGITYGVKADGTGLIQQNEPTLDITVRNNGLDTARFTQYNSLSFTADGTTSFFDAASEVNASRDLTVTAATSFHSAIAVVPQVEADADNVYTFYGMAMQPGLTGINGFQQGYGALFAVDNQSPGTSQIIKGLGLSVQNSGGGTITESFAGLTSSADNGTGTVPFIYSIFGETSNSGTVNGPVYAGLFAAAAGGTATDLISLAGVEPVDTSSGGMSGLIAATYVDGTFAIKQTDSAATGTINALALPTSHIHLTGNPTINGIAATNRTAQYVILTCSAGMTINNESGSATATDRIITGSGAAIIIVTDGAITLKRDITNSRWRVVSSIL